MGQNRKTTQVVIRHSSHVCLFALCLLAIGLSASCRLTSDGETTGRWWKGNTHTHTLWSDGDAPPEHVIRWYVENDYDFLVLSDHNVMQQGERWFAVTSGFHLVF